MLETGNWRDKERNHCYFILILFLNNCGVIIMGWVRVDGLSLIALWGDFRMCNSIYNIQCYNYIQISEVVYH